MYFGVRVLSTCSLLHGSIFKMILFHVEVSPKDFVVLEIIQRKCSRLAFSHFNVTFTEIKEAFSVYKTVVTHCKIKKVVDNTQPSVFDI